MIAVEANPAAQTATVTYDLRRTSVEKLRRCIERCGFECAGCNVPGCLCDPSRSRRAGAEDHGAAERAPHAHAGWEGGHSGHSMAGMAQQMRNRFLLSLAFTLAILAWSDVGKNVFGSQVATPFGVDRNVW